MDMRFWLEKAERDAAVSEARRATSGSLRGATDHPRRDTAAERTASA
jgi:hypothetical protein